MNTALKDKKSVGKDVLYPELSYQIMQAVFEVHNALGPGFTEDIYENALVCELESRGIPFERQKQTQIFYNEHYVGTYRLDLIVDQKIVLELKAVTVMNKLFMAQLYSYLRATKLQLGLLINFGTELVEYKRVLNVEKQPGHRIGTLSQ